MENKPVENVKTTEINGRTFLLKKMDARTGSYMLFKLMKLLPPILENIDFEKFDLEELNLKDLNLTKMLNPIFELPEEEFRYIQDNCLKAIDEMLPAGAQALLNKNSQWGVSNIENDMGLVMNLTIQSLVFNLQGFFAGSPLSSLMKKLSLSQPNM